MEPMISVHQITLARSNFQLKIENHLKGFNEFLPITLDTLIDLKTSTQNVSTLHVNYHLLESISIYFPLNPIE